MARTVIEYPQQSHFSTDYTVLISDINSANHFGADKMFSLMIEVQMRFFSYLGYDKTSQLEGVNYLMGDTEFIFKAESFYADQLTIDVAVGDFSSKGFELLYRVKNNTRNTTAAYIKAGMVFFDLQTARPVNVPTSFKKRFTDM